MGLEIRTVGRGGGLRATIECVRSLARLNFGELGDDLEAFASANVVTGAASIDSAPSHAAGRRSARATPLIQGITRWKSAHFTAADLDLLRQWDTPTICNGLELIVPERRAIGFTVEHMVAADRKLPPIVGLARTGLIRAKEPSRGPIPSREDWYDYVAPDGLSTIVALQDIDDRPGYGAFWGEVQSTVHLALGVLGCVTNGSFRDVDTLAPGFQIIGGRIGPSHAHVHLVQMRCEVNIFGMLATHDDVIHADFHGAVVIPASAVKQLPQAIELVLRREKVILETARSPGFNSVKMREILKRVNQIH